MRIDLLIVLAAFVAGTLVAELFGAVNTGTAFTFGQLACRHSRVGAREASVAAALSHRSVTSAFRLYAALASE